MMRHYVLLVKKELIETHYHLNYMKRLKNLELGTLTTLILVKIKLTGNH